jgi:SAM-dependent methyltransferase
VVDGSRLDAVCHRLKILWPVRSPILPGCVTVFYDLFRGVACKALFYPDAAEAELSRAQEALSSLPPGSLLLGDRLYGSIRHFHKLAEVGVHGLVRKNGRLKIRRVEELSRRETRQELTEEHLVEVGCGVGQPTITLRLIRYKGPGLRSLELLTDVVDARKLPAGKAVALYGMRWSIERMFLDLKKTLDLGRIYSCHPNVVAQQFYATVMVYNGLRVAQARVAGKAAVLPEQLSPEKLFPRLTQCVSDYCFARVFVMDTQDLNPGVAIRFPSYGIAPSAYTTLRMILLRRRKGPRRRHRFCPSRRRWKSFAHVPGGPTLIRSATDG